MYFSSTSRLNKTTGFLFGEKKSLVCKNLHIYLIDPLGISKYFLSTKKLQ